MEGCTTINKTATGKTEYEQIDQACDTQVQSGEKREMPISMTQTSKPLAIQKTLDGNTISILPKVRTTAGHMVEWDRNIIINQLLKETKLSERFHGKPGIEKEEAHNIAKEVEHRIRSLELKFLSGPLIREIVNIVLLEKGHIEWRNICTRVGTPVYDACEIDLGSGFEAKDNANLQENAETSHKKKADKISKEQYLLLLPPKIADLHLDGDIHIHDLEYLGTRAFCQDWDLRYFFYYGLMPDGSGAKASVAGPAMKAEVAILHAVKALGSAQTNFAGGQGFYNFLTFLAPYLEGKSYIDIKQLMQMFVYEMTQMMVARGGQVVFSSVQLSPGVPKLWKDKPAVYKGRVHDGTNGTGKRTYSEFEREVRLSFKALMDVMIEGDNWGKPFNFPKPEISIEPDFIEEDDFFNRAHPELPTYEELYDLTFELAAKFGTPYFDNQLPEYRGAGEGISCYQCCAYQFSANADADDSFDDKLLFKDGKHFSMGSWQVVSLNCPRAAYRAKGNDEALFADLRNLMDQSIKLFKTKRSWMESIIENSRMPFATQRPKDPVTGEKGAIAVDIGALVNTIGVIGINEMVQYHIGSQIHESKEAFKFAIRAMTEMEMYGKELTRKHGMEIALARTPAETTCQRFAVSDMLHDEYKDAVLQVVKGDKETALANIKRTHDLPVYYTNGTHVPPGARISLVDRMNIEHVFFPIVDGGNICHIWMGEGAPDAKGLKEFAMNIAKNTQIGYFAFTKDMTVCLNDFHIMSGLKECCENCGSEDVEQVSRVTGYVQAVNGWNSAKKQELADRMRYSSSDMI
jgi:ribonucleoside-triphosphate reductase